MYIRTCLCAVLCAVFAALALDARRPAPAMLPSEAHTWRVWIYMAADNDLARAAEENLSAVRDWASRRPDLGVSLAIQVDSPAQMPPPFEGGGRQGFWDSGPLALSHLGPLDMGDPATLRHFLRDAASRTHGTRTLLLLWGHGQGERGLLLDDHPAGRLSIGALAEVLAETPVDLLALDLCDMQSLGVVEALSGSAAEIIASSTPRPALGWSLDDLLSLLGRSPAPAQVTRWLIDTADEHGAGYGASSVHTASVPTLTASLQALAQALRDDPVAAQRAREAVSNVAPLTRAPRTYDLATVLDAIPAGLGLPMAPVKAALRRTVRHQTTTAQGVAPGLAVTAAKLRSLGLAMERPTQASVQILPGVAARAPALGTVANDITGQVARVAGPP